MPASTAFWATGPIALALGMVTAMPSTSESMADCTRDDWFGACGSEA